jgi:hypothetical protein
LSTTCVTHLPTIPYTTNHRPAGFQTDSDQYNNNQSSNNNNDRQQYADQYGDDVVPHQHLLGSQAGLALGVHYQAPPHALKTVKLSLGFFIALASISFIFFVAAAPSRYWTEHTVGSSSGSTLLVHHGLIEYCYSGVGLEAKCVDIASDCEVKIESRVQKIEDCGKFTAIRVLHMLSGVFVFFGCAIAIVANYWFDDHRPYHSYVGACCVCLLGAFCELLATGMFANTQKGTSSLKWGFGLAVLSFVSATLAPMVLLAQVVWERCMK